jgi:hypothetical protein
MVLGQDPTAYGFSYLIDDRLIASELASCFFCCPSTFALLIALLRASSRTKTFVPLHEPQVNKHNLILLDEQFSLGKMTWISVVLFVRWMKLSTCDLFLPVSQFNLLSVD